MTNNPDTAQSHGGNRGRGALRLPMASDPVAAAIAGTGKHCWEIVKETPGLCGTCEECYAYYARRDCWVLWALREPGHKPCCQKVPDCGACPILLERLAPQPGQAIQIRARAPSRAPVYVGKSKKVCQYLEVAGASPSPDGDLEQSMARALQSRGGVVRCRLRGVHLDYDYVSDVCVSAHPEECVFLEDAQPQVRLSPQTEVAKSSVEQKRHLDKSAGSKRQLAAKFPQAAQDGEGMAAQDDHHGPAARGRR